MCIPGVCSVKANESRIFCFPTCMHHLFALRMLVYLESSLSVHSNHSSTAQKLEVSDYVVNGYRSIFGMSELRCQALLEKQPTFLEKQPTFLELLLCSLCFSSIACSHSSPLQKELIVESLYYRLFVQRVTYPRLQGSWSENLNLP